MSHLWIYNSYLPLHFSSRWHLSTHLYIQYWYIQKGYCGTAFKALWRAYECGKTTENAKQCIRKEPVVDLSSGCQKYFMTHLQKSVCSDLFFSTSNVSVLQVQGEDLRFPGFPHLLTNAFPLMAFQDNSQKEEILQNWKNKIK